MIIVACPGQGSQTPGFLTPWLEVPEYRTHLEQLSEFAGMDLVAHGTTSNADTIRDTAVAQPLIVAASLLAWQALSASADTRSVSLAGHSVGEFAAASAAGVLTPADALSLVRVRGEAMADAAASEPTGMVAVVGGSESDVLEAIAQADLEPANMNGAGQIVAAGSSASLALLAENAPRGSRVIALQVAGAFHTRYMLPAVETLRAAAASVAATDPTHTLWTNRDGTTITSGIVYRDLLVGQVSSPVRWDLCMAAFQAAGITGLIELAPAGALTGIAKRGLRGIPTVAVKTPEDLAAAVELLSSELPDA
ncbi:ACP S-malonyltransferase [Klugiella xanthotipulae]|uniref:[acyl-carrier-protein] S-malonyltransferase n=1 Tax=Klugiella xanthotipulae TaxID=244735 RepID=A0A543HS26_9MICO|nr:ACP S-malonyltransferase [Klugiella xanthotipulae]TQM61140.1 [acyl-carrier-protein] S-malonyltransferase [Klugiella xanthotipulae]